MGARHALDAPIVTRPHQPAGCSIRDESRTRRRAHVMVSSSAVAWTGDITPRSPPRLTQRRLGGPPAREGSGCGPYILLRSRKGPRGPVAPVRLQVSTVTTNAARRAPTSDPRSPTTLSGVPATAAERSAARALRSPLRGAPFPRLVLWPLPITVARGATPSVRRAALIGSEPAAHRTRAAC
jgi:hypothetical protein